VEIAAATVPPYLIEQENGGLKVIIGPVNPTHTAKKDLQLVQDGRRADVRVAEAKPSTPEAKTSTPEAKTAVPERGPAPASIPQGTATADKKYSGQRISLDFKDADIKNVFRLLAEVSGLNIVVTGDVQRKVTLRLVDVPWDQALDLLIDTNGLGKEQIGNIVRISTAGQIKLEKDALAAAKKSEENLEALQTAYLSVNYAKVKELEERTKLALSPRGNVKIDERTNKIIVVDIKRGVDGAIAIVSALDTRTPQVLIESNLIETTPTFSRSLGIEMEYIFNDRIRASQRFIAGAPFEGGPQPIPTPPTTPLIIPTTGFRWGYLGDKVTSVLSAAEAEGNIKVISRPSIVTLNNVESSIEIGEVIRVKKSAATVGESGGIETFRAGIILTVTPQVSADGFVLLKIAVKASEFDFSKTVDNIPRETTREAKANVLVRDGETVVIGGIMKDRGSESQTGVPYLKDIPVLGWLFKKSSWTKDLTELVVFITPRITEAGSENLPTAEQLWREQMKKTEGG
jgi:type IV pilus assembly protein PilQ